MPKLSADLTEAFLGGLQFMDDVHNLRSKSQGAFFAEFLQSVIANLRPSYVQLVKGCSSFKEFADNLSTLHEDKRNAIMDACNVFSDKHSLQTEFWEQSTAVDGLNTDRNLMSHRSVADSAAAIIEAAAKPREYPEAGLAWAMLGALASYSIKNADALEAAARKERQRLMNISEQYLKRF